MLLPSPTDRLILRCWQDEDFPAFARMNADSRVMEYFPAPLSLPESAAFFDRIRREFETEGFGLYALERRTDGELLGYTGLHRVTFDGPLYGRVEIGWRLRSDMWGNGYATEAARSCLRYASLSKMESIISFTALSNLRSQRVMQRLGMTRLQEFDHPALPTGHPLRRHVLYMIRTSGYAETEPETLDQGPEHCTGNLRIFQQLSSPNIPSVKIANGSLSRPPGPNYEPKPYRKFDRANSPSYPNLVLPPKNRPGRSSDLMANQTVRSCIKKGRGKIHSLLYRNESPAYSAGAAAGAGC